MARKKSKPASRLSMAVANLRHAMDLTQFQLAALLAVTPLTVARWETVRPPSGPMLVRLRQISQGMLKDAKLATPERKRELVEIDNTFYSALVQEFPAYRMGLVDTVTAKISKVKLALLKAAEDQSTPAGLKGSLLKYFADLHRAEDYLQMLNPLHSMLPERPTPLDFAEKSVPMVLEGQTGSHDLPVDVVRRETERIKRALRRHKSVPGQDRYKRILKDIAC